MRNRLIGWTIGVFAVVGAVEANAQCGTHGPFANRACASPNYGEIGPSCCEPCSGRCDDVWAGYCQGDGCDWGFCWPVARRATEVRYETPGGPACVTSTTPPIPAGNKKNVVASTNANQLTTLPRVENRR
jgi:hypothetical protein